VACDLPNRARLPPHQRLVLDPVRVLGELWIPSLEIGFILAIVPLSIREDACSSRGHVEGELRCIDVAPHPV
jgi:hypothetical protein